MAWRACDVHSSHGFSMSYAMVALATCTQRSSARRRSAAVRDAMTTALQTATQRALGGQACAAESACPR